nr:MAG: replication associated protein [Cressdnaviricota sp.]
MNTLGGLGGTGGNTHSPSSSKTLTQVPKRKTHFFTINNPTEVFIGVLLKYFDANAKKYQIQEETGENGTPHLQGVVMFDKEIRSTVWDSKSLGHYEKLKGSFEDCVKYCSKVETRTGRNWSKGLPKPIKIIETLYDWQKDIEQLFLSEPDDRKIYWFWEEHGNIGKSAFVKYMVVKHKCLFCDGGKKADLINLVFNNDMDECKCVIWDLPRSTKGSISYSTLESIKNGMVCNTKYETGVKFFNSPHIFVFANYPPEKPEELSGDRWEIKKL